MQGKQMVIVEEAEKIILAQVVDYGTEQLPFQEAMGRVLAQPIVADRDLPPFNRATMDGIAIQFDAFQKGVRAFAVKAVQAAGDEPVDIGSITECIEIMTGGALPESTDTVVRYEDVAIENGIATVQVDTLKKGQNIHPRGIDKLQKDIMVPSGTLISPPIIGVAASVGVNRLIVKKLPSVIIISTGDELVDVYEHPTPYQVRRSNGYTLQAALRSYGITAAMVHVPDIEPVIKAEIKKCLDTYDVLLLSGGISMGKYDLVPKVLEDLGVERLFHKVQQRPGKPFWFGAHPGGSKVFAFPGNPVSTFMCLYRYFIPWLKACTGNPGEKLYAMLDNDLTFEPALQYFLQVKLYINEAAQLMARPLQGNGSGDFSNLVETDAFMELPLEQSNFKQGTSYPVWPYKSIFI